MTETASGEERELKEMSFLQHLEEFRKCLVRSLLALVVGFGICYPFSTQIFKVLMDPMVRVLKTSKFIYTYPPEAFFTYIKVSIVAGIFVISPYIFMQVWAFVSPGLYQHERKYMIPIAFLSAVFFVTGALFGYFIVFPFGFDFFASFSNENIQFTPKLSEYLSFSLKLLFAFGVIFELPLFIFFLSRLGVVSSKGLRTKRKYAILVAFICSAVLTPPDVITQTLMAGPLILLYEVGIWVAYLFGKKDIEARREKKRLKKEAKMAEAAAAQDSASKAKDKEPDTDESEKSESEEPEADGGESEVSEAETPAPDASAEPGEPEEKDKKKSKDEIVPEKPQDYEEDA